MIQYRVVGSRNHHYFTKDVDADGYNLLRQEDGVVVYDLWMLTSFPELKEDEVFASHVGDGEYEFNILGSLHRDIEKFMIKLAVRLNTTEQLVVAHSARIHTLQVDTTSWYVLQGHREVARLTVEKIDPDFPIVDQNY